MEEDDKSGNANGYHGSDMDLQLLADLILDQNSNRQFLKLLDTLPVGITLQDLDGKIRYANNTAAQVHGYTPREFVQSKIRREHIIAADDREKIAAAMANICENKFIQDLKIKGLRKDGSEFFLEFNARIILDGANQPAYCLILTRDITDIEEIHQAETKERALSDALIRSAALLSSSLYLDDVLEKILELAEQVVPHDSANIMLVEDGIVHVVRARGYKTRQMYDFTMSVSTKVEDFPSMVQMIQNGLPMVIPDTRKYPGWQTSPEFSWLLSYVGAPLLVKGKSIGVINLDSDKPDFFCEEDAVQLQAFADLAATAIANANLYKALQEQAEESSSLFRASTALLSASSDVANLARQITQTVHQDFSSAHVAILLIDETSRNLVQVAQSGYLLNQTYYFDINDAKGLTLAAIREKRAIYVADVDKDPRYIRDSEITRSEFDIPFIVGNNVIGVLNLESPEIDGFNERARKIILTYAERAAVALENARLIDRLQKHEFQMTLINQLTQISLKTSDLKEMLTNQVNTLYKTLSPDGVIISFSHDTIRKIMTGYAVAGDETINGYLNMLISKPDFSQKLAGFSNKVVTNDTFHESIIDPDAVMDAVNPFKAYILHPLYADGIHLGSAVMGYFLPRSFEKTEVAFFEQVIDQIALALTKNLSIMNANNRAKEAESLRIAASTLTSTLNLQEVFERVLETAVGALPAAENGLLFLYDLQKHVFTLRAQFGFTDSRIFTIRLNSHEGMAGKVTNEKRAQLFYDVSINKIVNFSAQKHEMAKHKSWIVAPLIKQDKVFGVIELCSIEADAFSENDLNILVSFADTVTAAIQNAQLHTEVQQIAMTDILTGLYNRRGFEEFGQREIHRSLRTSAPLSMLLVDVDYLKQVNDKFGHTAGDQILQEVADCCRSTFRQIDLVSRYGGDEYAIILPDTPIDHARGAAERLRRSIEQRRITVQDTEIQLSASIGVASFDKKLKTISQFFELADKALYRAKKSGRNKIACWDDPISPAND